MPSVALGHKSPFQKLFDKIPPLQHLRVFGTVVYPYIRPFNEHKLQPRTVQCVFMGYSQGYKGVICYNTTTQKFIISRHVVHDESIFPFKQSESSIQSSTFSSCDPSSFTASPIVVSVSTSMSPYASSTDSSIASSHPSDVPYLASTSYGNDPVLVTSSAESTQHLPVLNAQQLEVILPPNDSFSLVSSSPTMIRPMQTRSKNGIVKFKQFEDYQCYLATLPQLHEVAKPSTYKVACQSFVWV